MTNLKRILIGIFIFSSLAFGGCSSLQTSLSRTAADYTNRSATVTCYSGGVEIYSGRSQGKITSEEGSDGYTFLDEATGKLVEMSGSCVLRYD